MAQSKNENLVESVLRNKNVPVLNDILNHPEKYRCQVVYVQINRDQKNIPHFTYYYYRHLPREYWNPASTVKLPVAALALQKLNDINVSGVDKFTTIQFDSSYEKQTTAYNDPGSESGLPSVAHYIKRAFLISENDPYNRLYQFIGQETINRNLHKMGYKDARIIRQFIPGLTEDQIYTRTYGRSKPAYKPGSLFG